MLTADRLVSSFIMEKILLPVSLLFFRKMNMYSPDDTFRSSSW